MGWLLKAVGSVFGALTGAGSGQGTALSQIVDIAGRGVVDENKRMELVADLTKTWMTQTTTPTIDGVVKLMDHALWYAVIGAWLYSVHAGHPFDIVTLAQLLAGPAAFSLLARRK